MAYNKKTLNAIYIIMSLKIYNGIKFKSGDLPEIVSQLYAIKEQAKKNSNNNLMNDGGRIVHLMVKNKIIDNFEDIFTKEFTSDDYWNVDRLITASLDSRWRDRMEPNFNFNVCVIPWTDGNVYGIYYDDDIEENRALLNDIADEYHYQNQTDQPDDIDDEEWQERSEVWNDIYDKYCSPNDAGFIYKIVTSSDLHFDIIETALEQYKKQFILGYECKLNIKDEEKNRLKIKELLLVKLPPLKNCVYVQDLSWYSKCPMMVILCKDDEAKSKVEEILKDYSDFFEEYKFEETWLRTL